MLSCELAARVGRREPTAGTAVHLLLRRGPIWIERTEHDRRRMPIHPTHTGRAPEVEQFKMLMRRLRVTVDEIAGVRWNETGR